MRHRPIFHGGCRKRWQKQGNTCASSLSAIDDKIAATLTGEAVGHAEADSAADLGRLRGEKWRHCELGDLRRHAFSVVLDDYADIRAWTHLLCERLGIGV